MNSPSQFPSWHRLVNAPGFQLEPSTLLVRFDDGRGHRLSVIEDALGWRLTALIVRHAAGNFTDKPLQSAALRNRELRLCSLVIDKAGHLTGEAFVPFAGVTPDEFQSIARHLASECDRLEFMLTGRDREAD